MPKYAVEGRIFYGKKHTSFSRTIDRPTLGEAFKAMVDILEKNKEFRGSTSVSLEVTER